MTMLAHSCDNRFAPLPRVYEADRKKVYRRSTDRRKNARGEEEGRETYGPYFPDKSETRGT